MDCASAGLGGQVVACVALGDLYCVVGAITAPRSELFGNSRVMLVCLIDARSVWFWALQLANSANSCRLRGL